jgi:hypothetical protein
MIQEIQGDLFNAKGSLAHCVAADLKLGAGIAVQFKKRFSGLDELKAQGPTVGSICTLDRNDTIIYYLVTKKNSSRCYPTLETVKESLLAMKQHALNNGIKLISMPRIGSGLDQLPWPLVKHVIEYVFNDSGVDIDIYYL